MLVKVVLRAFLTRLLTLNDKEMKKETEDLLVAVIKDYMDSAQDDLNEAIGCKEYYTARDKAEDIMHYCNCLDQFEDVEMTKEEFSNYFSTFESWQLVKEWLKEPDNWEDDIRLLAEQNGLEEGVEEVIALLK